MQTVYYTTNNYIRHTGNVVDLMEYRRKLAMAGAPAQEHAPEPEDTRRAASRRRRSRMTAGLVLDLCASAAIVVLTVTVMIQFLVL
jgi:hypothetical protein